MASNPTEKTTTADLMKEIEDLKKQNQALEEAKQAAEEAKQAAEEAKQSADEAKQAAEEDMLNRANADDRLTQAVMKMNRFRKEVEEIPKRMEMLHERIRALVHDCRVIKKDIEDISSDMQEIANNKAVCQSISSIVGIIGGTVVFAAGTGGEGLAFSFVGFAASTFGFGARMLHDDQTKEQTRRAEKSQLEAKYKADEFVEDYKILADIRDRFLTSELFSCVELEYFKSDAVAISEVLNDIVEILRTLDVKSHNFVEKFDNMKNNYLLGVIAKRQKGVEEEQLCKEILNTIRDHVADYMPDAVGQVFVRGSDPVLEELSNTEICVDCARTVLSAGGVVLNFEASQSKNISVLNITTDIATGVEQAGELAADWGSKLTMTAKRVAAVTIILDIANLVSTYYTYKSEKAEREKLVKQAELLKERIDQLEEVNKSIDSFRKNLNRVLDDIGKRS